MTPKQRAKKYRQLAEKNLEWIFGVYILSVADKSNFPEAILFEPEKGHGYSKYELALAFLFCEQIAMEAES